MMAMARLQWALLAVAIAAAISADTDKDCASTVCSNEHNVPSDFAEDSIVDDMHISLLQARSKHVEVTSHQQKAKKGCSKLKTMFDTDTTNMSKSAAWVATHVDHVRKNVRSDVQCDKCGDSSTYWEVLSAGEEVCTNKGDFCYSTSSRKAYSNGCPNHYSVKVDRTSSGSVEGDDTGAYEQSSHLTGYDIPQYPVLLSEADAFDGEFSMGLIGIAVNGIAFYSGAVSKEELLNVSDETSEWQGFDFCTGHVSGFGEYHYHFPPSCLLARMNGSSDGHSPQIGWALDGFPIYGPLGPTGVAMRECGNDGADSTYCLDSCSGYEAELAVDNFKYRYYITGPTSDLTTIPSTPRPEWADYPFTIKCFRGCEMSKLEAENNKCKNKAEAGYTSDYVPVAHSGFTEKLEFANDKLCSSITTTTTTTTTVPDCGTCKNWCAGSFDDKDVDEVCSWTKCAGCGTCCALTTTTTTPTTTTTTTCGTCQNWCAAKFESLDVDTVCGYTKCSGCAACC